MLGVPSVPSAPGALSAQYLCDQYIFNCNWVAQSYRRYIWTVHPIILG